MFLLSRLRFCPCDLPLNDSISCISGFFSLAFLSFSFFLPMLFLLPVAIAESEKPSTRMVACVGFLLPSSWIASHVYLSPRRCWNSERLSPYARIWCSYIPICKQRRCRYLCEIPLDSEIWYVHVLRSDLSICPTLQCRSMSWSIGWCWHSNM